jgi:hypothetical protein
MDQWPALGDRRTPSRWQPKPGPQGASLASFGGFPTLPLAGAQDAAPANTFRQGGLIPLKRSMHFGNMLRFGNLFRCGKPTRR